MVKRTRATETATSDEGLVEKAIAEGRALIEQGKTKVDASMAIYRLLEGQSQEVVVKAFVEGASLTERGALTYWYNCRRKRTREVNEAGRSL